MIDDPKVLAKQVEVQSLPAGYFRSRLTEIAASPTDKVWVVAKAGYANDWSAYIGWPDNLSVEGFNNDPSGYYRATLRDPSGVLSNGDKLDEPAARELFSEEPFESLRYRR
jgi:hypothetical protein